MSEQTEMSGQAEELRWRHSGYTKTGWVSRKDKQNGKFFRNKLRDFFMAFSNIPQHEAADYTMGQIANWLDAKEVVYQNPSPKRLVIFSKKLGVGMGITFNDTEKAGKIHYSLVHLNLEEDDEEE